MLEILHACPANCATGGPEAIHAFVSELNKARGVHARIWYRNITAPDPMPEEYKKYKCEYVTELPEGFDGVLIVPEIWANSLTGYNCTKAIYWLGIDAYASWNQERGAFLEDESIIHIAQSEYAYDFLKRLHVKRLYKCVDVVNDDFYAEYDEQPRDDVVLYNPAKSTPFMEQLMRSCDGVTFKPIRNMTRSEVIDAMRHAKLYVDFGEFPGRERIPREAALCGCCLITSRIGSAVYMEDFVHGYKCESKDGHIWAIVRQIRYVLEHYDECRHDFDLFRNELWKDRERMKEQCKALIKVFNEIQRHNTSA